MPSWIVRCLLLILSLSRIAASAPLTPESTIDQTLDALHSRGAGLKDFTADVSLADTDALTGDTSTLIGKVWYQETAPGESRIRVSFPKRQVGQQVNLNSKIEYFLEGGWLIDRDYRRKLEVKRQVLKPGQKMNLLKLGEGPFPLPIGQKREDVLAMFTVKKTDAAAGDPPNTVHLSLTPKPGSQFERKFKQIEVWTDTTTGFPRRIQTSDRSGAETRTTDLTDVQTNTGLKDDAFTLEKINGWVLKQEAME